MRMWEDRSYGMVWHEEESTYAAHDVGLRDLAKWSVYFDGYSFGLYWFLETLAPKRFYFHSACSCANLRCYKKARGMKSITWQLCSRYIWGKKKKAVFAFDCHLNMDKLLVTYMKIEHFTQVRELSALQPKVAWNLLSCVKYHITKGREDATICHV